MESADVLLSARKKITFLGDFNDLSVYSHRWTLFSSLGDVFRIQFSYGEVRLRLKLSRIFLMIVVCVCFLE